MESSADDDATLPPDPRVLDALVASHRQFLGFLESRVGSRAAAEEILQAAFVRTLEKGGAIRDAESAVAWFYRLLRNAVADHYRRRASESRALDRDASPDDLPMDEELRDAVCACMSALLPTLKPEYAQMIDRVDLREAPLQDVAASLDITANNAAVRLHRARQALKKQLEQSCGTCAAHGCLDCSCASAPRAPAGGLL